MSGIANNKAVEHESRVVDKLPLLRQTSNTTTPKNTTGNALIRQGTTTMITEHENASQLVKVEQTKPKEHIEAKQGNNTIARLNEQNSTGGSIANDATKNNQTITLSLYLNQILAVNTTGKSKQVVSIDRTARLDTINSNNSSKNDTGRPHATSGSELEVDVAQLKGSPELPSKQTVTTTPITTPKIVPPLLALSLQGSPLVTASTLAGSFDKPQSQSASLISAHLTGEDVLNYALVFALPLIGCLVMLFIMWIIGKFCRKLGEKFNKKKGTAIKQSGFWGLCGSEKANVPSTSSNNDWGGVQIMSDVNSNKSIRDSRSSSKEDSGRSSLGSRRSTVQFETSSNVMKQQALGTPKRIPQWHTILDERKSIDHSLQRSKTWSKNKLTKQKTIDLDDGRATSLGQLRYSLSYDFDKSQLTLRIIEARNLPSMDLCGYSDPYVKVYMLSNFGGTTGVVDTKTDDCLYKTRIHKRTLNPVFNETFQCDINYGDLCQRTLVLSVYDYDRFSKHDEIGQIAVPLVSLDYSTNIDIWDDLHKNEAPSAQVSTRLDALNIYNRSDHIPNQC